ncbi:hypothetical protein [Cellulomonas hominis]
MRGLGEPGLPLLFAAVTFLCTLVRLIGIPAGATGPSPRRR